MGYKKEEKKFKFKKRTSLNSKCLSNRKLFLVRYL